MVDICIVFSYLAILLFVGIYQRSKSTTFHGFARIQGDVKHSKFMLVATIFASSIGGGATFGISEKAFAGNIAYSYGLFLTISIDLLIATFVVPRIVKHYGAETVGDIMSSYYDNTGRFISGAAAIMISLGLLAAQISVSGRIFEYILQLDYIYGVLISYGIILIYTTIGGFRAVLFANQLQFFAILISIPIVAIFGLYQIGFENFINQVPKEKYDIFHDRALLDMTIIVTLGFASMNLFPTFLQRALINNNPDDTRRAIYIKSAILAIFIIFITINGLIASIIFPDQKPALALPILIDHIIPIGIQGIVIVGLLASVMSTADADLNICSVTIVKDIIGSLFEIKNQKRLLLIARIANLLIGSLAILIALSFQSVIDLVIFTAGFWGPVAIIPLLFALFGITIPKKAMIFSSLLGAITFIIWEKYFAHPYSFKGVFIGTVTHLCIFILIYYFNKKSLSRFNQRE